MFVEELSLENIRCFESQTIRFRNPNGSGSRWVTFLSENGGGKSTALQSLALLLAGPEGAQLLLPRPLGWLRDEEKVGKISVRIHQNDHDPHKHGTVKIKQSFGYSYSITGSKPLTVNHRPYSDAAIVPSGQKTLTWLREKAFAAKGKGWFAVGYGAFRRLTRSSQILVPALEHQARYTNFITQFDESKPLSAFEQWLVYLDYRIAKENDETSRKQKALGVEAINRVLPQGAAFDSVRSDGTILFSIHGQKVPTIALSDGYRSVLAFVGDLVWRLLIAFPDSNAPLEEYGVVLIDELDIHLHPTWQRDIAGLLLGLFPNLQFIVASHSPLIAAGAGEDALTLRFIFEDKITAVEQVYNISAMNVDRILMSEAFGLVSTYSPVTQRRITRYDELTARGDKRTKMENSEYQTLLPFMAIARPLGGPPPPDSLDARIERFLEERLNDSSDSETKADDSEKPSRRMAAKVASG